MSDNHLGNDGEILAFHSEMIRVLREKQNEKESMRHWDFNKSIQHVLHEIESQQHKIGLLYQDFAKNKDDPTAIYNMKSHMARHHLHTANYSLFGWLKTVEKAN